MIGVLIQTDGGWQTVAKSCEPTWRPYLEASGYKIFEKNFAGCSQTFLEALTQCRKDQGLQYIGCMFEDLFFKTIHVPHADDIERFMVSMGANYFRLDGRPPASKASVVGKVGNVTFGQVRSKRYCMSTVLGFFSAQALAELSSRGCASCWDIENERLPLQHAYAPTHRTARYHNVVHRGKVDWVGAWRSGVSNGLFRPVARAGARLVKETIRKIDV